MNVVILGSQSQGEARQVDCVWNVMAHAQKPYFVFRRNGRVHLNRRGRQFSRLLGGEVCASAVVMLDTPCSEVVWEYLLPTPFAFPLHFPTLRHLVPSHFNWTLQAFDILTSRGCSRSWPLLRYLHGAFQHLCLLLLCLGDFPLHRSYKTLFFVSNEYTSLLLFLFLLSSSSSSL